MNKNMVGVQGNLFPTHGEGTPWDWSSDRRVERYYEDGASLVRVIRTRRGEDVASSVPNYSTSATGDPAAEFDQAWLRSCTRFESVGLRGLVRVADLFSGAGGMSIGLDEAARALGMRIEHVFAADIDSQALSTYTRNFSPSITESRPIQEFVDGHLGTALSFTERALRRAVGGVDLVVGGPPCQGHSDLNNHTRREDPKNALYERMARVAEVLEPTHLVIENVPGVQHDRSNVFHRTLAALDRLGYNVDSAKLPAEGLGVPQRRRRAVIVASRARWVGDGFLDSVMSQYAQPHRAVGWAIGDLLDIRSDDPIDVITSVSAESQDRIDWLFDNGEYDLPDRLRPECHRTKKHSYKSVYGRLYWDRPAWTITTGFQVMGQGRFLHPLRRRVITSHEAARLQFFPDFFDFGRTSRKGYAKMIGNAVPPKLAYVIGLELLR